MEVTPFLKTSIFASVLITKRKSQYSTRTLDSTRMHSSMMRTTRSSSRLLGGMSASVHARIPPWVWAWRQPPGCEPGEPPRCGPADPPGVGLDTPPSGQTPQLPLGCGPGDLQGMLGCHPPPGYLQGMLGYHLQCMLGYPPPRGQNSWHTLLKILPCPKLRLRAVKIVHLHANLSLTIWDTQKFRAISF